MSGGNLWVGAGKTSERALFCLRILHGHLLGLGLGHQSSLLPNRPLLFWGCYLFPTPDRAHQAPSTLPVWTWDPNVASESLRLSDSWAERPRGLETRSASCRRFRLWAVPALPATWPSEPSRFLPVPRPVSQAAQGFAERVWVCLSQCGLGFGFDISKARAREPMRLPGYLPPIHSGEGVLCFGEPGTPTWHTPCTLTPEPARVPSPQASWGGNASVFLSASPGALRRPSASSEARSGVQAWSARAGLLPGCDSGLSQARQDVSAIHRPRGISLFYL